MSTTAYLTAGILIPIAAIIAFKLYMKTVIGRCNSKAMMINKTVLITGCDKGIGYYTALDIAKRGGHVIMACRNLVTAKLAADKIIKETCNNQIFVRYLDVSSLASVRDFVKSFLDEEERLDVLICNAGTASGSKLERTNEGFECTFVTNYLGHFLLTMLLLERLKKCIPSRIVNVSSVVHKFSGDLEVDNFNYEKSHNPKYFYAKSKMAQILCTKEMAKKLEGTGVTVNSLHPGAIRTNIFNKLEQPFRSIVMALMPLMRSAEEGAQTTIYLAVSEEVEGVSGQYFSECKIYIPSKGACDDLMAKQLFEKSLQYCNLETIDREREKK